MKAIKSIEQTLSNLEIAGRQLEKAIVLFLNAGDHISALILVGAADERLGKSLTKRGR